MRFLYRTRLLAVLPFIFLLAAWYLVTLRHWIDPVFLPSPVQVFVRARELATGTWVREHLVASAVRVAKAFSLSVLIALPLGVICGRSQLVNAMIHPVFAFVRYLPVPSLVPLCILWFGIDDGQKVAVITIGVVFQLVILLAHDSASVPQEFVDAGRTMGLSSYRILKRIVLPAALPSIWDHLRVSAGWAWSYLVLSELVAGRQGVGYFVVQSQRYLQTDYVFAGILFIGIVGAITDLVFRFVAARAFRWT